MKKIIIILFLATVGYAKTILFLGDSLTEGYGLNKEEAYPSLVQKLIKKELDQEVQIINAGVSGSTTSDGIARMKWYLRKNPDIVFIALGANDGLRGLDLNQSQNNLEKIINMALSTKAKVLLSGMLIPPNYGQKYTQEFKKMYLNLSEKHKLRMMPFLLESVAGKKEYNQSDGIHPNEKGHEVIAKDVFEFIKEDL
jgi:acyl-CoA thioesterase-1